MNGVSHNSSPVRKTQRGPPDSNVSRASSCSRIKTEAVAFGYLARALVLEQRVRRPLAIRDMRRSLTAGDGLAHQFTSADFRSGFY